MSNTGTVQDYKKSESGRTKVKIDGQWYNAGNGVDISANTTPVGSRISFDSSSKDWNGKQVWWLNKYGALPASSNGVHADPAPKFSTAPYAAPKPPTIPTGSLDEPTLRFISNCVGSAITAGTIKDPADIERWVSAARNALKEQRTPGEDDDI